jgi:CRP-like cAMP-binding protein
VGDPGDYLAVLLSGSIEISKGTQLISVVEPGSMFGEMGIIDRQPRVADAVAKRDSRIAELREGQFTSLLQATPEFGLAIMRLLTDRVRRRMET